MPVLTNAVIPEYTGPWPKNLAGERIKWSKSRARWPYRCEAGGTNLLCEGHGVWMRAENHVRRIHYCGDHRLVKMHEDNWNAIESQLVLHAGE